MGSLFGLLMLLLIPIGLGFVVKDNIEHGVLKTSPLIKSLWAILIFGIPVAYLALSSAVPGSGPDHGALEGIIKAIFFFVAVLGVFVLPVLGAIVLIYLLGYLFWLAAGRRRIPPTPKLADTEDSKGKSASVSFGKSGGKPKRE